MQRRTFLKVGLLGGALLAAAGGAAVLLRPTAPDATSLPGTRTILRAVMPALLAGALPADPAARAAALDAGLARSLAAIAGMPLAVRRDLGTLIQLLDSAPGRWLADVTDWESAPPAAIDAFLQRWRTHRLVLLQAGYHALHDLVLGPWYAEPSTWPALGYPGPIRL